MNEGENNINKNLIEEDELPTQEEINNNNNINIQISEDYYPPPAVIQLNQPNTQNIIPQPEISKPTAIPISSPNEEYPYPYPMPNDYITSKPTEMPNDPNIIQVNPVIPIDTPVETIQTQPVVEVQPIQVQPVIEVLPTIQVQQVPQVNPVVYHQPVIVPVHHPPPVQQRKEDDCAQFLQCLCICLYCFAIFAGGR